MNILYATDLHGDERKYEAMLEIATQNQTKIIINGGDILPKRGNRHDVQPIFIDRYLRDYFGRLNECGIIYLVLLGNDDLVALDEDFANLCNEFDNVHNMNQNKVEIDGYEFIGMDSILDHPFGCKDRVVMEDNYVFQRQLSVVTGISTKTGYDKIFNWVDYALVELPNMRNILNALPTPNNPKKAIYIMHMPPARMKLGQLYHQNLDIGSEDIRQFIKEKQPLLTLHGHIHEAPETTTGKWINHIADTTCIQPGQTELNDATLIYAEIDLDKQDYARKKVQIR